MFLNIKGLDVLIPVITVSFCWVTVFVLVAPLCVFFWFGLDIFFLAFNFICMSKIDSGVGYTFLQYFFSRIVLQRIMLDYARIFFLPVLRIIIFLIR